MQFLLNICILEYCYTPKLFATQVMTFGGRIVEWKEGLYCVREKDKRFE